MSPRVQIMPLTGVGAVLFLATSPLAAQVRTAVVPPGRALVTTQLPPTAPATYSTLGIAWNAAGSAPMSIHLLSYGINSQEVPAVTTGAQAAYGSTQAVQSTVPILEVRLAPNDPSIGALQAASSQQTTATLTLNVLSAANQLVRQCTMGNARLVSLGLLSQGTNAPAGYDAKFVYQSFSCTP